MACSGSNCSNYGTGTSTCNQHRDACSTNRAYSGSGSFGASGQRIYASDIDLLRQDIIAEINAFNAWQTAHGYGSYGIADPGSISSGEQINHAHINDLRAMVDQISSTGYGDTGTGSGIGAAEWSAILNAYNTVRQDCICNSDCSCNNVCACFNDCGCNYSDIRLKENIELVGFEHGLNIYTWNYVWDNTKRFIGVMAQELLKTNLCHAVSMDANGYYKVDYTLLPVTGKEI